MIIVMAVVEVEEAGEGGAEGRVARLGGLDACTLLLSVSVPTYDTFLRDLAFESHNCCHLGSAEHASLQSESIFNGNALVASITVGVSAFRGIVARPSIDYGVSTSRLLCMMMLSFCHLKALFSSFKAASSGRNLRMILISSSGKGREQFRYCGFSRNLICLCSHGGRY